MELLLVFLVIETVFAGTTNGIVTYKLVEGANQGEVIGYLFRDSSLYRKYSLEVLQDLQLEIVNQKPNTDRLLFDLDAVSGLLKTSARIDRDLLCPRRKECEIQLDVSVNPIQYFEIIKVTVSLLDFNDNTPNFDTSTITKYISEATLPDSSFALPLAEDVDSPNYGVKRYQLLEEYAAFSLVTEEREGEIFSLKLVLNEMLDREDVDFYQLHVLASDGGDPAGTATLTVNVTVLDINDHRPSFTQATYSITLEEDIEPRTSFVTLKATDQDLGENSKVTYDISERGTDTGLFAINEASGEIYTTGKLNRESQETYRLYVTAKDHGPEALTDQTVVNVRLLDINDEKPVMKIHGLRGILETTAVGSIVAHLSVTDKDTGKNGEFECYLDDEHFTLEKVTDGEYKIKVASKLDYESQALHKVNIKCRDFGEESLESLQDINIKIIDHNDNKPVFSQATYSVEVPENNTSGAFIFQVSATDSDQGPNGDIYYTLSNQAKSMFSIDGNSGIITANSPLDYEQLKSVDLIAFATDNGETSLSSSVLVTVNIFDINDEAPVFAQQSFEFHIRPPVSPDTPLGQLLATDRDEPPYDAFTFNLIGSNLFSIDKTTGMIYTNVAFDHEEIHTVTVVAEGTVIPHYSNTAQVTLHFSYSANVTGLHSAATEDRHSFTIILSIVFVAILCISLLITGIAVLVIRNKKRKLRKDHCTASMKEVSLEEGTSPLQDVSDMLVTVPNYKLTQEKLAHFNHTDYKAKQIADYLEGVKDNDISGTTEGSSSDSGKGASDDGDLSMQMSPPISHSNHTLSANNLLQNVYNSKTSTPIDCETVHNPETARNGSVKYVLDNNKRSLGCKQNRVSWKDNLDSSSNNTTISTGAVRQSILKSTQGKSDNLHESLPCRSSVRNTHENIQSTTSNCDTNICSSFDKARPVIPPRASKPSHNATPSMSSQGVVHYGPSHALRNKNIHFFKSSDLNESLCSEQCSDDGASDSTTSGSYIIDEPDSAIKLNHITINGVRISEVVV